MWMLYIAMSFLSAGVVLKLVHPLLGRGRFRHGGMVTKEDKILAAGLVLFVPVSALAIYLFLGNPDLPSNLALYKDPIEATERRYALLADRPMKILLEKNPDSVAALISMGEISMRLGRYAQAVSFYARAVPLAEGAGDMYLRLYAVELGKAQVSANNGVVGEDAVRTFEYVRKIYADSPLARYYLTLARAQRGEKKEAVEEWLALLHDGPGGGYWRKMVRDSISQTQAELKE